MIQIVELAHISVKHVKLMKNANHAFLVLLLLTIIVILLVDLNIFHFIAILII